jgi:hypothetical protein
VYNPIVPPQGQRPREKIFLIASDACFAAYANTNARRDCNAEIFEQPPKPTDRNGHWMSEDPFNSLDQWIQVVTSPILSLRLTKNVKKGEEIFAYYDLPPGVRRFKPSADAPQSLLPIQEEQHLQGSIALEGDEDWSTLSDTHSPTEDSGYSGEESTRPTSPDNSPPFGAADATNIELQQLPVQNLSPPLNELPSKFTKRLSLCTYINFDACYNCFTMSQLCRSSSKCSQFQTSTTTVYCYSVCHATGFL